MVVGIPGITPEQQAQAFCTSSVSPTCNAANLPILIEGGVVAGEVTGITGDSKTVTGVVKPKGSKFGLLSQLGIEAAGALMGFLDMFSVDDDGTKTSGGMSPEGLVGQEIQTDPAYLDKSGVTNCKWAYTSWQTAFNTLNPGCSRVPIYSSSTVIGLLNTTVNASALTVTRTYTGTLSLGFRAYSIHKICKNPINGVAEISSGSLTSPTNGFQAGYTQTDPMTCSTAGATLLGLVGATYNPATGSASYERIWRNGSAFEPTDPLPGSPVVTGSMSASVDCQNAAGVISTIVATVNYSVPSGSPIPVPDAVCPAGTVAVAAGLTNTNGGTTTDIIPKTGDQITPEQKEFIQAKPECFTAGQAACLLVLYTIATSGKETSCGNAGELCPDWAKDPDATTNYRCKWGGEVVDLRACSAYRMPALGILPNVKPDGSWQEITAPAPPNIQQPKPGSTPGPTKPTPEQEAEACKNSAPSWFDVLNPFWVAQAVGCALRDAFVPRASAMAAISGRIGTGFNNSTLGSAATFLHVLEQGIPSAGGCGGIPWEFKVRALEVDASLLNSCPGEPLHEVAGVVRGILVPLLWTGAVLLWVRYLAGIVGYVPFGSQVNTNPGTSTAPPPIEHLGTLTQVRPPIGPGGGQKAIGS